METYKYLCRYMSSLSLLSLSVYICVHLSLIYLFYLSICLQPSSLSTEVGEGGVVLSVRRIETGFNTFFFCSLSWILLLPSLLALPSLFLSIQKQLTISFFSSFFLGHFLSESIHIVDPEFLFPTFSSMKAAR